jgi:transposase
MRGIEEQQGALFSYVSQEDRIPHNHPLRKIRTIVDPMLKELSPQFDALYAETGRPSIPPEQLLRSLLVQVFYTIRSERLLIEELNYNLLFRWFVGLSMDDEVWDHSVYTKNRDRLLDGNIAEALLRKVVDLARQRHLLSDEHFTVDGTLIEAWAGQKSFKEKGTVDPPASKPGEHDPGNPTVNFHGEKRSNDTHQSTTDPESRLYRKGSGKEAKLFFMGHVVMDNRNGLAVATRYTQATGTGERDAAEEMLKEDIHPRKRKQDRPRITVGADKLFDTADFVTSMKELNVTPHVAQNDTNRSSAIDKRTTRHSGYEVSQWKRKLVEEIFGWVKTIGLMRKTRHKGVARGGWMFTFTVAAYDLIRIKNLTAEPTG